MDGIRSYALSIVCTALLAGIITDLAEKTAFVKQVRLVCSIFLTIAVINPILSFSSLSISDFLESSWSDTGTVTEIGKASYADSIQRIIQEETEAYILKEAKALGADIRVQIGMNNDSPPVPSSITILGSFDGAAEERLSTILAQEFHIPKEQQTWIRQEQNKSGNS